jgi:hypothetical protein
MKDPLTILFVEDSDGHLADLQQMLAVELPRLPIRVNALFARYLLKADALFDQADAVMTDVFFPVGVGREEGCGKTIVERCLVEGKPVVWVTSTYHHGTKTDPLNEWGREHGLEMFDCVTLDAGGDNDNEGEHKPWKSALLGLLYTVTAVEIGEALFKDGNIVRNDQHKSGLRHSLNEMWSYLEGKRDIAKEPVLSKMKEEGFPLD